MSWRNRRRSSRGHPARRPGPSTWRRRCGECGASPPGFAAPSRKAGYPAIEREGDRRPPAPMRMTSQAQHSGHASQPVHPLALANALAFMPFGVGGSFFAGRLRDIGALKDCEPEAVAEDSAPVLPVSDGTLEQPHRACRDDGIARHARRRGQPGRTCKRRTPPIRRRGTGASAGAIVRR